MVKCPWAVKSATEEAYHDLEWGVPEHDDIKLFEFLILEGVQAGLSWRTVLEKRANYRIAFNGFNPELIADYDDSKLAELMQNTGLIRNKLKLNAAIINARAYLKIQAEFGSFDAYVWQFVDYKPIHNNWQNAHDLPSYTDISSLLSKDLQKRGFKFVGKTICYAYMQAIGMVNDHLLMCYRHAELMKQFK